MQFRPEDISEREHQRRFGVSKATIVNPRTETTSPVATDKKQLKFRLFPHLIPILYWRDSRRLARSYRRISKLRISWSPSRSKQRILMPMSSRGNSVECPAAILFPVISPTGKRFLLCFSSTEWVSAAMITSSSWNTLRFWYLSSRGFKRSIHFFYAPLYFTIRLQLLPSFSALNILYPKKSGWKLFFIYMYMKIFFTNFQAAKDWLYLSYLLC